MNHQAIRKEIIKSCRRVVVKAGTRLLTDPKAIPELVAQIKMVRDTGRQVILVSSGAVGTAMKSLGLKKRPTHLSDVQALAAMGQVKLMSAYEKECAALGFRAAQILLTADDLRSRERHLNACNCIEALLARDVLPVINENDPVSVDELKFGDNDILAALLASMTRSDLAIILTTVDGLLQQNPDGSLGERIPFVCGVSAKERAMATGTDDGSMSIGGMTSKLKAADTTRPSHFYPGGNQLSGRDAARVGRACGPRTGSASPSDAHCARSGGCRARLAGQHSQEGATRPTPRCLDPQGVIHCGYNVDDDRSSRRRA